LIKEVEDNINSHFFSYLTNDVQDGSQKIGNSCVDKQKEMIGIASEVDDDIIAKTKEIKKLLKKLQEKKRLMKQRILLRQKKLEEQIHNEAVDEENKAKKLIEERIRGIRERSLQKYREFQERRKNDNEILLIHKKRIKFIPTSNRLYKRLEEKDTLENILQKLNESLNKEQRNSKHVSLEEINKHSRNYDLKIKDSMEKRRIKLEKVLEEERIRRQKQKELFSIPTHHTTTEINGDQRKVLRKKMINYGLLIKEIAPVTRDKHKMEELNKRVELLNHPVRKTRDRDLIRRIYNIMTLKKYYRSKSPGRHLLSTNTNNLNLNRTIKTIGLRRLDYLKDQRLKRESYLKSKVYKSHWAESLNNDQLKDEIKRVRIMRKAILVEEMARMKEKLLRPVGDLEGNQSIFDMLIDSIKAKIALFENSIA